MSAREPGARRRVVRLVVAGLLAATLGMCASIPVAHAQRGVVIKPQYYLAKSLYYEGDYEDAIRGFHSAARGGVQSTEGRWVDSVCYHTMTGESYYRAGNLPQAMDQYNAALQLAMAHSGWMLRVQFSPLGPEDRTLSRPITWGVSSRRSQIGKYPDTLLIEQGRRDNITVLQQGGVVSLPELYRLNVNEVARCTALALYRRQQIMGPVAAHDPMSSQLVNTLAGANALANHWSQSWVDVQRGLAYMALGDDVQAASELTRGLMAAGQFDHPLTPLALQALGDLAFKQGKHDAAAGYYLEATYPAAWFAQYDVIEECLHRTMEIAVITGKKNVVPALSQAAAWARRDARRLESGLQVSAAENLLALGDAAGAVTLLEQVRRSADRNSVPVGELAARMHYLSALAQFQRGNVAAGITALSSATPLQRSSSTWLYQIALADRYYTSGVISPRIADLLYSELLREPTPRDWSIQPRETLVVLNSPAHAAMERWFELTVQQGDHEKALEVADRIRRTRFFSSLPLGGRLLALRWVLSAPEQALSESGRLQRQALLVRFPRYGQLAGQVEQLRAQLAQDPLFPAERRAAHDKTALFNELDKLSEAQEKILHEIALRREPCELAFPPLRSAKQIRSSLAEGQAIWAFLATSRNVYSFMLTRDRYAVWKIDGAARLRGELAALLREMGNFDKNQQVSREELADGAWTEHLANIGTLITGDTTSQWWTSLDELVIVPDGLLWYLPFEALLVGDNDARQPLIQHLRLRYTPTVGLALPDGRPRQRLGTTALVTGKVAPKDDDQLVQETIEQLRQVLPATVVVPDHLSVAPPLIAPLFSRLVVLRDLDSAGSGAVYGWSPMPSARSQQGQISQWLKLPWGAPDQIVLPGFHTPAESGLKRGGSGDELFLNACALLASGSRTALLSRWRLGGQSTQSLVKEFVQELPHVPPSEAWQRSVRLLMYNPLDAQREPRVREFVAERSLTTEHPFFWSGYLLIDISGGGAEADAAPPLAEDAPGPQAPADNQLMAEADAEMVAEDEPKQSKEEAEAALSDAIGVTLPDPDAVRDLLPGEVPRPDASQNSAGQPPAPADKPISEQDASATAKPAKTKPAKAKTADAKPAVKPRP